MTDKNLWSKLGLIVLLVGLSVWQMWPPEQKLKPGIDLGGGHSLLFEVDDSGLEQHQKTDLASKVMAILKQRVDPTGGRNLVWRPIGWNRIEIQMPRPSGSHAQHRVRFEEARNQLVATGITESQIRSALALSPEQRDEAFAGMTGPVTARKPLFEKLARLDEEYHSLQATASQPVEGEMARKIDEVFVARRATIEELLKTNLDVRVLSDILQLDRRGSVRAERLAAIEQQKPDLAPLIKEMTAGYDEWAKTKGALDDPADLMRLLRGAGKLEFRILAQPDPSNPNRTAANNAAYREEIKKYLDQLAKYGPRPRPGDNFGWFRIDKPEENDIASGRYIVSEYLGTPYVLAHSTDDMGLLNTGKDDWKLRGAYQGMDRQGRPAVHFELDKRGGDKFGLLTRNNLQKPLAIFLDGAAMSAATIQSEITTSGQITGNFSRADVDEMINTLNAGVLPARLKEVPLQQKSVGPALGATNRAKGMQAVVISFLLTVAFMTIYYSYNGVIANIALLMNLVITLGVMSFLQATFTLPGIAGLVLTLGMAVDANVLIFERMREELTRGVSARMAVKLGYEKAFSAILDGNVTTILTAVILGSLGSEEIKGFGLTLGIGLCTSMFTALFVTRQYFNIMVPNTLNKEETQRAWMGTGLLAIIGAVFMGLGYLLNRTPDLRAESSLSGFGELMAVMFATAAVLMLSLWFFRFLYRAVGHQQSNRLAMMKLMAAPKIDWMAKIKVFWPISAVIIVAGFLFEIEADSDQYLDIEFLGGTSVQIQIRDDRAAEFAQGGDEKLLDYIRGGTGQDENDPRHSVGWLLTAANQIEQAPLTAADAHRYRLAGYSGLSIPQIEALLVPILENVTVRGGVRATDEGVEIEFDPEKLGDVTIDVALAQTQVRAVAEYLRVAANKLRGSRVQLVEEETATGERAAFEIITTETQRPIVAEALVAAMGPGSEANILEVVQPIEGRLVKDSDRAPDGLFPIRHADNVLSDVIGGSMGESVAEYKGGVALVFEDLQPPATIADIEQRLREMRLQPDFEETGWREPKVLGLEPVPGEVGEASRYRRIAILVVDSSQPYIEGDENIAWRSEVAQKELELAQAALETSRSLQRVTQFAPQVAGEAAQKAIIAIILSIIAIAAYLWVRFGSLNFGLAGVIALYHDVAVTMSCVMLCHHIHDTALGRLLLLTDFKIDLAMVAAFLTIVGYSINDTIVIFDRIRENRGRLGTVSAELINDSLNQTLSRTIITSFTLLIVVVALYVAGGEGIHGFAFAMIVGTLTGCYSTLAIATPMVHHPRAMWVVAIVLAAVTAIFVVAQVTYKPVQMTLQVIVVLGAVALLIRQWMATGRPTPRHPHAAA